MSSLTSHPTTDPSSRYGLQSATQQRPVSPLPPGSSESHGSRGLNDSGSTTIQRPAHDPGGTHRRGPEGTVPRPCQWGGLHTRESLNWDSEAGSGPRAGRTSTIHQEQTLTAHEEVNAWTLFKVKGVKNGRGGAHSASCDCFLRTAESIIFPHFNANVK